MTIDTALRLSAALVGVSATLIALEYVVLARGTLFARGNLLDREVLSLVRRWTCVGAPATFLRRTFEPKPFLVLVSLQALFGVTVVIGALMGAFLVTGAACLALFTIGLFVAVRHPFGRDGADEMLSLALVGLSVACLVPYPTVKLIAILFICGQLTLSYFVAGVAKLGSRVWMVEGALRGILNTEIYGRQPAIGRWFRAHPRADLLCGLSVVAMEVGHPLVFVVPDAVAVAWLAVALTFHLGAAAVMGLNTFLFVFSGPTVLMYWLVAGR